MIVENTIIQNFRQVVKRYPHKRALMYKEDGVYRSINFNEFWERIKIASIALQKFGIKKGDKVAILSNNRPEWAITDLATIMLGAVVVPIHMNLSAKIINYILNHSEAKLIVVSNEDQLNKLSQVELNFLGNFIFLGDVTEEMKSKWGKIISWKDFMVKEDEIVDKVFEDITKADDVCTIIYTSGTTGVPKGVELTHKNFLSDVHMVSMAVPVKESDIFLSFLPLSHVLERMAGYYIPILHGATIAYAENIKTLSQNLKEVRPTIMICVPRIFEKLYDTIWDKVRKNSFLGKKLFYLALKQKKDTLGLKIAQKFVFNKVKKSFGGRLRFVVSGGASLNEKMAKFFNKLGILILEGYGLTETAPVISVNREKNFKFGTVGMPLQGLEVKITAEKEIIIKGSNVMKGYYNNEKETKEVLDSDGWFHTGDYGFMDGEGFLVVIGRKKEMIVTSGGKNIWPEHIEQELNYDRLISQSIIVGHGRKFVSALVAPDYSELELCLKEGGVLKNGKEISTKDPKVLSLYEKAVEKVNNNLSEYEKIRKFILVNREFSQELDEITPTLKIRRNAIEHHFRSEIDSIYF